MLCKFGVDVSGFLLSLDHGILIMFSILRVVPRIGADISCDLLSSSLFSLRVEMKRVHTDSIAFCRFKRFIVAHAPFLTCSLQVFVHAKSFDLCESRRTWLSRRCCEAERIRAMLPAGQKPRHT